MMKQAILIFSICFALSTNLAIYAKACDSTESYKFYFSQIQLVTNWKMLKKLHLKYLGCDDGAFAEGFSDRTDWLFQNRYSEFFDEEIYKDSEFYRFVKRHIDQSWVFGKENSLRFKLEKKCPKGHERICGDLLIRLEDVVEDSSE